MSTVCTQVYFESPLTQVTGSTECVEDIAASNVLGHLLQVCYSLPENQGLALTVLHSLMGDTRIVKEGLGNGMSRIVRKIEKLS